MLLGVVVDWEALGEVIVAAFVAGVGVTTTFAVAIVGVTRFDESRRNARPTQAAAYGVVAGLALAACAAAVVLGIVVMAQK
jgi:hypothetical protein